MRMICVAGIMMIAWLLWESRKEPLPWVEKNRLIRIGYERAGSYCSGRWERWRIRHGRGDGGKKARLCGELYLGQSGRETLRMHEAKRWGLLLLICTVACLMGLVLSFQEPEGIVRTTLEREAVGDGGRKYELHVRGLEQDTSVEIQVGNQVLTDTKALFDAARKEALEQLFSEGETAECVREDLHFPNRLCDGLVSAVWEPAEPQYIRYDGAVLTENLREEGVITELRVTLTYEEEEVTELIAVHLKPPQYTKEEEQKAALQAYLQEVEKSSRHDAVMALPEQFEGNPLTFIEEAERVLPGQALGLGVLVAVCLFVLADRRLVEEGRRREEQMKLDYPEVVLKLTVLIRAGLTVRGAWDRIVDGYATLRKNGQKPVRYVYEEMLQTSLRMQGGLSEAEAYREFGKRTHLHVYLKLSSMLEQNLKKGSRGLVQLLEAESEDAWAQRKNVAKQKGEEAGTRLLIPMFLLLVLVMLLIMIPAVLSF